MSPVKIPPCLNSSQLNGPSVSIQSLQISTPNSNKRSAETNQPNVHPNKKVFNWTTNNTNKKVFNPKFFDSKVKNEIKCASCDQIAHLDETTF